MKKTFQTKGIVLKKREWRENDLLFSILTEKYGLVKVIATGVRKPKSKLAGHLSSLGFVDIVYVRGRVCDKLTHAYLVEKLDVINEQDYLYSQAMFEIVQHVLEIGERNENTWNLVVKLLPEILKHERVEEKKLILNVFIVKLVSGLGYQISDKTLLAEIGLKVDDKLVQFIDSLQKKEQYLVLTKKENEILLRFLNKYLSYFMERHFKCLELLY